MPGVIQGKTLKNTLAGGFCFSQGIFELAPSTNRVNLNYYFKMKKLFVLETELFICLCNLLALVHTVLKLPKK